MCFKRFSRRDLETGRKFQGVLERNQRYTDLCEFTNNPEAAIPWKGRSGNSLEGKTLLTGISAFMGENWT